MDPQALSEQLVQLRERLLPVLKRYRIQKAIVFGSFARGDISRRSDVDLILVQQTAKRFWERYEGLLYELNCAVPDRELDVLIYTPAEFGRARGATLCRHRPTRGKDHL